MGVGAIDSVTVAQKKKNIGGAVFLFFVGRIRGGGGCDEEWMKGGFMP